MQKFSDWRVGTRLGAAFAVLMLFAALVGGIGMVSMSAINQQLSKVVGHMYPMTVAANGLRALLLTQMSNYQRLSHEDDASEIARIEQATENNKKQIALRLQELDEGLIDPQARDGLARYIQVRQEFSDAGVRIRQLARAGQRGEAEAVYRNAMQPLLEKIQDTLLTIVTREHEMMLESYEQSKSDYATGRLIMVLLIVAAIVLGAARA